MAQRIRSTVLLLSHLIYVILPTRQLAQKRQARINLRDIETPRWSTGLRGRERRKENFPSAEGSPDVTPYHHDKGVYPAPQLQVSCDTPPSLEI